MANSILRKWDALILEGLSSWLHVGVDMKKTPGVGKRTILNVWAWKRHSFCKT
jgi:hypothetical protein